MVIICANTVKSLPKEKFCQVKVGSNIAQKSLPKENFVKLKSVRTLLRIACVADRKSYVVIVICASSCEKLTKSEFIQILLKITSIVPNLTFKGHLRSKVIQFKDHEVN